ncbi:endonuclease [Clostridioides difficile]|nr:GIY-YIG nuclease family protein [Clostridioides difficile]HBG1040861.1 GIY-YIG nuclease family protein [Clostridioides difficile]HCQ5573934.1 GIY-YIG nuclease family protein [Clostridioides difficile]
MHCVYKYINPITEECLYVGKTENICNRHSDHLTNKKEDWCNQDLRFEYMMLDDKYVMDFYEMYLINKLKPKFNKVGKGKMDKNKILFSYDSVWKEYLKEDFSIDLKALGYGITYQVDECSLDILKKLKELSINKEISIKNRDIKISCFLQGKNTEVETNNFGLTVLKVVYSTLGSNGLENLILMESENTSKKIDIIIKFDFLKKIAEDPLMPKTSIKDLNSQVNDILKIIDINCEWDRLFDYCSTSY